MITFEPHPRCVLTPESCPQSITTLEEKLALLDAAGVAEAVVLRFTRELAALPAAEFMTQVEASLTLKRLAVGYDFALGRGRQGNVEWLRHWSDQRRFELVVVAPVEAGGVELHSSDVRRRITAGEIEAANQLLGRPFSVAGVVEGGDRIGHRLGYPTANVSVEPNKLLPGHGIYAGRVRAKGEDHVAAVSVGYRPQFQGTRLKLEAYLLDFTGDLYHQPLEVRFFHRLRDEARFGSEAELVAQMQRDVEATRQLLG